MRMLGGLLEREVTRDDPEWAAAMASLKVSEKVKIKPSRRQHKKNERDCRISATSILDTPKRFDEYIIQTKRTGERDTKETITFEDHDQKGEEVEQNLGQESLSGEKDVEEVGRVDKQDPGQESLSGKSGAEEMFMVRNKTWRRKFCPGSSGG